MAVDPAKNDEIWKNMCNKEFKAWQSPVTLRQSMGMPIGMPGLSPPSEGSASDAAYYRVPMPGEPVTVSGMRRRPELNGAHAEVVDSNMDEFGRVTVRVFNSTVPGHGTSKKMKIQPFRLMPSSSSPSLTMGRADDMSSVCSMSRAGSVASFANRSAVSASLSGGGSRLGSALGGMRPLSSAGRSALSGTGSMRQC